MTLPLALFLHTVAAAIWVGGMVLIYVCIRPALAVLDQPQQATVWSDIFARFFKLVWVAIFVLLISGHWMIYYYGGFVAIGRYIPAMTLVAYIMFGVFGHVYYALYRPFTRACTQQNWKAAFEKLARMRWLMALNIMLGICTIGLGVSGKYIVG